MFGVAYLTNDKSKGERTLVEERLTVDTFGRHYASGAPACSGRHHRTRPVETGVAYMRPALLAYEGCLTAGLTQGSSLDVAVTTRVRTHKIRR